MANKLYPKGAEKILSGAINFDTDTLKAALVPSSYTFSTSHEFADSLGTLVGTAQTLANTAITGGVFDADDVAFGAQAPGSTVGSVVIYKDTGTLSTSPLLIFLDDVTGLPLSTNGGAVTVPWSSSAAKIMSLV